MEALLCPISMELMMDPVMVIASGHTYERAAIEEWFMAHNTDPVTNETVASTEVVANHVVKSLMSSFSTDSARHEQAFRQSIEEEPGAQRIVSKFLQSIDCRRQNQTTSKAGSKRELKTGKRSPRFSTGAQ
jgi:hypothetical protein